MKRFKNAIRVLILLTISLLGCLVLFGCDGAAPSAPEVKDVKITAEDGSYGKAGAKHIVTYTVPEGSKVSESVQLGGNAATSADYACRDGGYYFYTAGVYTVTVYAAKDGMSGSASATLTVVSGDAYVGDVEIAAAAGETYGKVGALHVLHYRAPSDSTVEVTVQKGDETATDVRFDSALHTLEFGSAGEYTVTVTATLGSSSAHGEAQIEIIAADPPEVGLTLDRETVAEDGQVTLTRSAVYEGTDRTRTEEISVLYRKGKTGSFRKADDYTLTGDVLTPHLAGQWRVEYTVTSRGGATATARAEFTCTPAELTLAPKTSQRQRIEVGSPAEEDYLVTGAAEKYNVSFDTHGSDVTAEAGAGHSVRVTSQKTDYFTVTVVYTHKVDTSVKETLDLDFYSVENLYYAPVWGEDPFCGMPDEVLTNMGHLLYLDAAARGGRQLTAANAVYEVVEKNVTASGGNNEAGVRLASNNADYPYLFMDNLDDGVARGDFTLKATLTDPYTGFSAVALKKFTVTPTGNDNSSAARTIQDYVKKYPGFYRLDAFNFSSILGHDVRLNMILTRTGTIVDRVDAGMTLNNGNQIAMAQLEGGAEDCRLEFAFTLVASAGGAAELGIGLRTANQNGWAGSFNLTLTGGKLGVVSGIGGAKYSRTLAGTEMSLADGGRVWVRIDRRTGSGVAEYTFYMKEDGGQYRACYCFGFDLSASAGNAGAPVAAYQFDHHSAGCFGIEELSLVKLS